MKLYRRFITMLVFLAIGFGLTWVIAKYIATPPPSGEVYRVVPGWPRLPPGIVIGQISGVGVDSCGDVFVFHRAERFWGGEELTLDLIPSPTVLILNNDTGDIIEWWGADMFVMPHGLTVDHEDNLWLTDVGLHQVFKFDRMGNLLMALGERGIPGEDSTHFNMPTDVALAPDGSFYVSDGYRNSRVLKFSPDGDYITSWGSYGTGPGQFDVPHSIALDSQGKVYVADRGNARLQIFDEAGQFIAEWKGKSLGRPWAVRISATGNVFLIDGGDQAEFWPDRARILKLDSEGNVLASFGSYGDAPGQFVWPHALALAPDETLYVGEVATGMRIQKFTK
jgi:peptidylamidoglycolate lyase